MKQKQLRPSYRQRKGAAAQPLCCAYLSRLINPAKSIILNIPLLQTISFGFNLNTHQAL
jgi:hypothetical protein